MEHGKIWIHRKILDWQYWNDVNTFRVFIYLLLIANWKDKQWNMITVKRGQVVTSIEKIALATGLTYKQVRLSLSKLQLGNEIVTKWAPKYRIITITNYDTYQTQELTEGSLRVGQRVGQRATTKEYNNVISKETNTTISFECEFFTVTNEEVSDYCKAYNTTEEILTSEFIKMKRWIINNPDKRKKNYGRFIGNWLTRHFNDNGKGGGEKSGSDKKKELDAYMERTFGRTTPT